jgi:formylglycine-generating enzyme required for sulfatase activity
MKTPASRKGIKDVLRFALGLGAVGTVALCGGLLAAEQTAMKHETMNVSGINITLVKIPKGSFIMGHAPDFVGSSGDEKPAHKVTFSQDFWMGATAITVGQWKYFVAATGYISDAELGNRGIFTSKTKPRQKGLSWRNPGIPNYTPQDNHPVLGLSWEDAMQFCEWLTNREQAAGRLPAGYVYRLPTEAQWEYVARDRKEYDPGYWQEIIETEDKMSKEEFSRMEARMGVKLAPARERAAKMGYKEGEPGPEVYSVYRANSGGVPNPVGTKQPNSFGVYDMMGNGWNWVYDWYGRYPAEDQVDPQGPLHPNAREIIKPHHEMRGGSWTEFGAHGMMTTNRWSTWGMVANQWVTFRIALTTVPPLPPGAPLPGAMADSTTGVPPGNAAKKGGGKKK